MRFMSDDQPSSAAANPVKRLAMSTSTSAPCETHTATTETDSQWLPKPHHPKGDSRVQKPWEPETADFKTTRPQLRTVLRTKLSRWSLHVSV